MTNTPCHHSTAFCLSLRFFRNMVVAIMHNAAAMQVPEYIWPPKKSLRAGSDNAPAIGVPIRLPTLETAHTMPILAPSWLKSGLNSATAAAGSTAIGPENSPHKTQKVTKPPKFDPMLIQDQMRISPNMWTKRRVCNGLRRR